MKTMKPCASGHAARLPRLAVVAAACAGICLAAGAARAQTVYTWNGSADSVFSNTANWASGLVAPTNNAPGILNARISVQNGAANPLVYTAAEGHTIYAASGGSTSNRSLFIASGGSGSAMSITGGTFESQAAAQDGIANAATGTLTINGGAYVNTVAGSKTFLVVFGGGGSGTVNVNSGSFAVTTLKYGDSNTQTGTGTVNLNGGTLSVGAIQDAGAAGLISNFNFGGGTLRALGASSAFMQGLDSALVKAGGAVIDSNGFDITVGQALLHDPALGATPDGGLTKTGAGILTLTGANTYTGATTVSAGAIRVQNASALGATTAGTTVANDARVELAGGITVSGEALTIRGTGGNFFGALQSASGTNTWDGPVTLGANDTRLGGNGAGQVLIVSGPIGDGGAGFGLFVRNADGGGQVTLTGANTYGGLTTVFRGVLNIQNFLALGSAGAGTSVENSATLQLQGGISVVGEVLTIGEHGVGAQGALRNISGNNSWSGLITMRSGTQSRIQSDSGKLTLSGGITSPGGNSLFLSGAGDGEVSGPISGVFQLFKEGSGTWTLSAANPYTTPTVLNAGTLLLNSGSGNAVNSTAVTVGSGSSAALLLLGAANQISDSAVLTFNGSGASAGVLRLAGNSETVGGLASTGGAGIVENESGLPGTATLTLNVASGTQTFGGVVRDGDGAGTDGTLALVKSGGGTQVFTGANSYSGATTVSAGALNIQNALALGSTAAGTTVASGARLELQGGITVSGESVTISGTGGNNFGALQSASGDNVWDGPVILNAADTRVSANTGTLEVRGVIQNGAVGTVRVRNNTGTTIFSGANTYTGNTEVLNGILRIAGGDNRLPTGTTLIMGVNGPVTGLAGFFDLNGRNQTVAGLDDAGLLSSAVTNAAAGTTSTFTVNNSANFAYDALLTNAAGATLNLVKSGGGTLTLTGANSYTGTTTVSAGVLNIQNASALGTGAGGTTVANGARLELAGGITVAGESITISGLGGNNVGALQSQSGDNLWGGPVLLGANDTRIGANGAGVRLTVSGVIDDGPNSFNLAVRNADGGGETVLTAANTYGGATNVVVGTLRIAGANDRLPLGSVLSIGNGSNVATATFDLGGFSQTVGGLTSAGTTMSMTATNSSGTAGALTVNSAANFTYAGVLTGNLAFTKQGSGVQTLSGLNTYTGATDVQGGTLRLSHATSNNNIAGSPTIRVAGGAILDVTGLAGTADLVLASGQTLQGNGTVLGNLSVPLGATVAAGDSPGHFTQQGVYTQAGTMEVEIWGKVQGVSYDWIEVTGGNSAVVDGLVRVGLGGGFTPATGDAFDVLTATGVTVGPGFSIDGAAAPLLPAQYWSWRIAPFGTGGQALELFVGVPEPGSVVLLALGLAAWLAWGWRRRRAR